MSANGLREESRLRSAWVVLAAALGLVLLGLGAWSGQMAPMRPGDVIDRPDRAESIEGAASKRPSGASALFTPPGSNR